MQTKTIQTIRALRTALLVLLLGVAGMGNAQVSTWDGSWEPWTHGTGTETDPFLIENARQLAYLAYRVNNGLDAGGGHVSNHDYHYKLMVDIDLNGSEDFQWMPIGYWNSNTDYQCFGGHFDGNGHAVCEMYINSTANRLGFFGYTDGANINALGVKGQIIANCTIYQNTQYVGGIVGFAENAITITNCYNTGNVTTNRAGSWGGGILGFAHQAIYNNTIILTNCYNTGRILISTGGKGGGIVGAANGTTTITNCYNTGDVTINTDITDLECSGGGIAGQSVGTITNCYNTGNVVVNNSSNSDRNCCGGGIIGMSGTITNCYNIGIITAHGFFYGETGIIYCSGGGIVGYSGVVNNSYYLNTCGGNSTYGGQPISEEAMKTIDFVDLLNDGFCAWKQDNTNTNHGYPRLTMLLFVAETYPATNIASSSVTLNGFVYTENANIISKGFEYRKLGDLNYTSINVTSNSDIFSYNLIGLTTNTTYEYRTFLNVTNCDETAYGETKTFELSLLDNDTICIYNADMLRWVSEQCNSGNTFAGKYVKLMNDITLPLNVPNNMTSIGVYPSYPFKGTFDGNGKHITNLYIDQPNTPYQGFFGYTLNANLYNVGLVNITASGRNYTGGMVAYAENTYLRDCYVNGGTLFALSYCGGLVGYQQRGTNSIISGCYNTCEVTGNNYVGGLVGFSNYSTVRNSYVAAMVAAQGEAVGSIIGGANEVLMYYCYFNSELTGQADAIGENNTGKDGGEAMTSAQMRDPQFVATLNSGLTFRVWKQDYTSHINNGFPILQWQQGVGIEENGSIIVSVYPNPTNGLMRIEAEDIKSVCINNMLGQVIYEGKANGDVFEYDFGKHEAGVYLVRIETARGVITQKVTVTK